MAENAELENGEDKKNDCGCPNDPPGCKCVDGKKKWTIPSNG